MGYNTGKQKIRTLTDTKITIEMCTLIATAIMTTPKYDLCNSILGFPHIVPGTKRSAKPYGPHPLSYVQVLEYVGNIRVSGCVLDIRIY